MDFVPHAPDEKLAPYIQSIFHFSHFCPDHSIERVVPDGFIYLIFELDGFERHTFDNQTLKPNGTFTRVWLSGMHKHYLSISAHQNSEMFVVQFKPGGFHPFISSSVAEMNNRVVPAQHLFGNDVLDLHQALHKHKSDNSKMFELAEAFLTQKADFSIKPARELVDNMLLAIIQNSAALLQDVVEKSGYSHKQAIQVFKEHVGLNPKSFQRIVRFNEILPLIMKKQSIAWSDICANCYYYDQSHFIREFKAFCGYSPKEFLLHQGDHPEPNFFPLD